MADPATQFQAAGLNTNTYTPVKGGDLGGSHLFGGAGQIWAGIGQTALNAAAQLQSTAEMLQKSPVNPNVQAQQDYMGAQADAAQDHLDWLKAQGRYGQMVQGTSPEGLSTIPAGAEGVNNMLAMRLMAGPPKPTAPAAPTTGGDGQQPGQRHKSKVNQISRSTRKTISRILLLATMSGARMRLRFRNRSRSSRSSRNSRQRPRQNSYPQMLAISWARPGFRHKAAAPLQCQPVVQGKSTPASLKTRASKLRQLRKVARSIARCGPRQWHRQRQERHRQPSRRPRRLLEPPRPIKPLWPNGELRTSTQ